MNVPAPTDQPSLSRPLRWALAASLAAAAFVALLPDDDAPHISSAATASRSATPARSAPSLRAPLAMAAEEAVDPLPGEPRPSWPAASPSALLAWGGEPPPRTEPQPMATVTAPSLPAPQAPPFPYALIGRIDDERGPQLLLNGALKTIAVRPNDVIDGQWRVDTVQAGGATLTWLPGNLQQTVTFLPS